MFKAAGLEYIEGLKTKWISFHLIRSLAISMAASLVLTAIAAYFFSWPYWISIILLLLVFLIKAFIRPFWKITVHDVSRYLNATFPELEESAGLLLKPSEELSMLEQMQTEKITKLLPTIKNPEGPVKKLRLGCIILTGAVILSALIYKLPPLAKPDLKSSASPFLTEKVKENIPAQVSLFTVTIAPPAYTGRVKRIQQQFSLKAEIGATATWDITTNKTVEKLKIIFNDKEVISPKPMNADATKWRFSKVIHQPGFYQLEVSGHRSDLYQIEVVPDIPVSIKITHPKQNSTIDFGQPQEVKLSLSLTDDYGISDAFISATMASGKGEGVSFTEKKLLFNTNFNNKRAVDINKVLDLKALGMKPGDELYFFVKAIDNHGQSSRSDVYFVSIVDTTELMNMAGMTNGVNLVPEYFRSQRQIIIDTEKLLKEKGAINAETFNSRSNTLGVDQKLLRLRYGKFLGEESETEIGGNGHDHDDDHKAEEKFGDVSAIMDQYTHKHDIAEDATFFEPELKAQLKAVLTEMWTSELHLRTYKPEQALPYEYKALRLLKDLQQKSRSYVAKATVKTSVIKEEKRLSGELDKITEPVQKLAFEQKEKKAFHLKNVLSLLEARKTGKPFDNAGRLLLSDTEKYMITAAADNPGSYLSALKGLRRLTVADRLMPQDIELVQQAVQKMMKKEQAKPQLKVAPPASSLYQNYFNHLQNANL